MLFSTILNRNTRRFFFFNFFIIISNNINASQIWWSTRDLVNAVKNLLTYMCSRCDVVVCFDKSFKSVRCTYIPTRFERNAFLDTLLYVCIAITMILCINDNNVLNTFSRSYRYDETHFQYFFLIFSWKWSKFIRIYTFIKK